MIVVDNVAVAEIVVAVVEIVVDAVEILVAVVEIVVDVVEIVVNEHLYSEKHLLFFCVFFKLKKCEKRR